MALIDSFTITGEYSVEDILVCEGFEQCENGLCKKIIGINKEILIRYTDKRIYCELRNKSGVLIRNTEIAVQHTDRFFERYGMLMYTISDFLTGKSY